MSMLTYIVGVHRRSLIEKRIIDIFLFDLENVRSGDKSVLRECWVEGIAGINVHKNDNLKWMIVFLYIGDQH